MPDESDDLASDRARRMVVRQDRMTLRQIVAERVVCEATGTPLNVDDAVAMTVLVRRGVSRLAVVSGAHWDNGNGALSVADPDIDPDVLDGRKLFAREGTGARPGGRPPSPKRPTRGAVPMQQPRPQVPEGTGVVPRV